MTGRRSSKHKIVMHVNGDNSAKIQQPLQNTGEGLGNYMSENSSLPVL